MTFLLIGASHRTAPVDVRERLVVPEDEVPTRLRRLLELGAIGEAMILSTCNRTEVVVHAEGDAAAAIQRVKGVLGAGGKLDDEALERILYVKSGRDAIRHLFRLGVGLDSMILGEPQILGQVKAAYARAESSGTLGSHLRPLFQRVFSVAKKVRTDTDIGRNPVSVSYAAVGLAHQIFGALNDRAILLLGAGETAELCARHLAAQGIREIFVANRTFMRAEELAARFGGEAVPFDRFLDYLVDVDVLISSTSSTEPLLRHDDATQVMRRRRNRPLFLIDLAVPRDIEPEVNEVDNLYLYDVDDLQHVAEAGLEERRLAAEKAERQVEGEVLAFEKWARAQEVSPTIIALRNKLDELRDAEFQRFQGRLQDLDPQQRQAVEELASSLINKVLHGPIRHLKRSAASSNGADRVSLIRQLFGIQSAPATGRAEETEEDVRKASPTDEVNP